jgi:hypothetical protein
MFPVILLMIRIRLIGDIDPDAISLREASHYVSKLW